MVSVILGYRSNTRIVSNLNIKVSWTHCMVRKHEHLQESNIDKARNTGKSGGPSIRWLGGMEQDVQILDPAGWGTKAVAK
jgi:hypothetical protein